MNFIHILPNCLQLSLCWDGGNDAAGPVSTMWLRYGCYQLISSDLTVTFNELKTSIAKRLTSRASVTTTPGKYVQRHVNRSYSLWWRHNGRDGVSNHQPNDCLLNRLYRRRSKKTSKLRVTGLLRGIHRWPVNSPHKWPVTLKMSPFDDVIMLHIQSSTSWQRQYNTK